MHHHHQQGEPSKPLVEVSPSTLNRTAFPANSKKRTHYSPSQSPSSLYSLSPSTKQKLQRPNINLKRSSGVLNLSSRGSSNLSMVTTSPSTSRIIQNNYSKNDEMLKSFNELSFEQDTEMDIDSGNEDNDHEVDMDADRCGDANGDGDIDIDIDIDVDTAHNSNYNYNPNTMNIPYSRSTPSIINLPKRIFPLHKHSLSNIVTSSMKPIDSLSILSHNQNQNQTQNQTQTQIQNSSNSLGSIASLGGTPPLSSGSINNKKSNNIFGSIPLRNSSSSSSTSSSISPFFKHDEPSIKKNRFSNSNSSGINNLNSSTPRKKNIGNEEGTANPLNLPKSNARFNVFPNRRIASAPIASNGHYLTPFNQPNQEKVSTSASLNSVKPLLSAFSSSGLVSKSDKSVRDQRREKWKPVPETPMKRGLRDAIGTGTTGNASISNKLPTSNNNSFNNSLGTSINNSTLNTTVDGNGSFIKNHWIEPSRLDQLDMQIDDNKISASNVKMGLNGDDDFKDLLSDLNPPKYNSTSFDDDIIIDNESPTIKKSARFTMGLSDTSKGSYWQRAGSQQSLVSEKYLKPLKINHDNSTVESFGPKTPVETFKRPMNISNEPPSLQWTSSVITDVGNTSDIQKMEIDSHLYEKFGNCSLVGNGEFSLVYEVGFKGIKYAVKKTKDQISGPKKRKRLWEEVELLKEVSVLNNNGGENDGNDYVVTLISAWEFNNQLYIMTDYCENGTLDKFLLEQNSEGNRSKLDEWRIWKILVELMLGLNWVHKHDIIHLDLKPANIFITFDGTLKIGDFGVGVKLPITNDEGDFDREGDREYIAPEIISRHEYTTKADIFSVGLIMLETAANVVLPENGSPWRKLRSGDLSDAGRLSSGDLAKRSATGTASGGSLLENIDAISMMEDWKPVWFCDGSGSLDKIVNWMMLPNPLNRPSAEHVLRTWECMVVELRRQSGATIYEGDFGPTISREDLKREKMILETNGAQRVSQM